MTADLNMSYGSSSKGDRTAAPGHQLVMPFLRCGAPDGCSAVTVRPMLCKLPPWSEWACKKAGREVYRQWGSGAVPKRELQKKKKKKPTLREGTSQTDIPQHLNFPGQLYLNETSHSKSVKAISRRTEEYFNHDTKHWIAFWCDTLPLRRYYSCQWDWYVSIC